LSGEAAVNAAVSAGEDPNVTFGSAVPEAETMSSIVGSFEVSWLDA